MLTGQVRLLPPELRHDVNTDVIAPSAFLRVPEEELGRHAFGGVIPDFQAWLDGATVLVAGRNFGCGSSREQAPKALIRCGIELICAETFASIFFRNALNLGLAVLVLPSISADAFSPGQQIAADLERGMIRLEDGSELQGRPLGAHLMKIVDAGGILPMIRCQQAALQ
jgi:3-isopropylmalate dehydratase small subunit